MTRDNKTLVAALCPAPPTTPGRITLAREMVNVPLKQTHNNLHLQGEASIRAKAMASDFHPRVMANDFHPYRLAHVHHRVMANTQLLATASIRRRAVISGLPRGKGNSFQASHNADRVEIGRCHHRLPDELGEREHEEDLHLLFPQRTLEEEEMVVEEEEEDLHPQMMLLADDHGGRRCQLALSSKMACAMSRTLFELSRI